MVSRVLRPDQASETLFRHFNRQIGFGASVSTLSTVRRFGVCSKAFAAGLNPSLHPTGYNKPPMGYGFLRFAAIPLAILALATAAWPQTRDAKSITFDEAVQAAGKLPRIRSLLVSCRGELLLERYFHGARATSQANIKSAAKSVISALTGIAIARRLLPGVHAPIAPYFPELARASADPRNGR